MTEKHRQELSVDEKATHLCVAVHSETLAPLLVYATGGGLARSIGLHNSPRLHKKAGVQVQFTATHEKTGLRYSVLGLVIQVDSRELQVLYRNQTTGDTWLRPAQIFGEKFDWSAKHDTFSNGLDWVTPN